MLWFKPVGIIYRPLSLAGWVLTLLAAGFCIHVFLRIDSRSHSISDTLYGVVPYWLPTLLAWLWIAGRTSGSHSA